jgi:hypothetical protein
LEQLRQRVFQIACGYDDQNDASSLRFDPLLGTTCDRLPDDKKGLSSQSTFSRLEHLVRAKDVVALQRAIEDDYVASLPEDTTEFVLDLDSTSDPTHGQQQLSFFRGHYDTRMYFPLLVPQPEVRKKIRKKTGKTGTRRRQRTRTRGSK